MKFIKELFKGKCKRRSSNFAYKTEGEEGAF